VPQHPLYFRILHLMLFLTALWAYILLSITHSDLNLLFVCFLL
jgi:hypothetical protein